MSDKRRETEEKMLEVVRKWKHFWMNQKQNSEADYKNYFERAFGIDANMTHHLAKMITDEMLQPDERIFNREEFKEVVLQRTGRNLCEDVLNELFASTGEK